MDKDLILSEEKGEIVQQQMAELFNTTRNNITLHIGNIFKEGELEVNSVRKESLLTAADGKKYRTKSHYDGEDMEVDETTQTKFFKYCNDTAFDYQLILIDNKAPDEVRRGELSNIHYIQFTKEKGFYLGKE